MASSDDTGLIAGLGDAATAAAGSMRPPPPGEGEDPVGIPPAPGGTAPEGLDNAEEGVAADWDMALCPSFFSVLSIFLINSISTLSPEFVRRFFLPSSTSTTPV